MGSQIWAMVQGACVSGVVTSVLQALWYYGFQRREEKRDKAFELMADRIRRLEEEKIQGIQDRLASGSEEFDEIHQQQEHFLKRPDFLIHQDICDKKFAAMAAEQRTVATQLLALNREMSSVDANLKLIVSHLKISL